MSKDLAKQLVKIAEELTADESSSKRDHALSVKASTGLAEAYIALDKLSKSTNPQVPPLCKEALGVLQDVMATMGALDEVV